MKASGLATQFNQIDQRLGSLNELLNQSARDDAAQANALLDAVAKLNAQIHSLEQGSTSVANDLRDLRQARIEELARLVKVDVSSTGSALSVSIAGTLMVSGGEVLERLELYDTGQGQLEARSAAGSQPLALTGGTLQGTFEARDGAVAALRDQINTLASHLITEVNAIHTPGFSLTGSSGAPFFVGTNASDIRLNSVLLENPALLQAAAVPNASGDNQVAVTLGQFLHQVQSGLGNRTFSQSYSQAASVFGQALSSINSQLSDQQVVEKMLLRQRDAISGVSLDEEMADLTRYQRAFEASARLISTVDSLLDTVVNLKR
jgi:flagellar hook-associated protein 1